jgi:hypothetical protein
MSALGQKQTCAPQNVMSALPPIATSIAFFGMSALGQKRTFVDYSITSSANEIKPDGMVSPRALAVLRLITKSKFVGCRTGKSLGLAPLRMRPT